VNPALEAYQAKTEIVVSATDCNFHIFVGPWSKFTDCDKAKDYLTKLGLSFRSAPAAGTEALTVKIGDKELKGAWDPKKADAAAQGNGIPGTGRQDQGQLPDDAADPLHHAHLRDHGLRPDRRVPGGALPDEDPVYVRCRCRITSATGGSEGCCRCWRPAMVAASGDIYYGLWYPIMWRS
jgi:hypothetical protein